MLCLDERSSDGEAPSLSVDDDVSEDEERVVRCAVCDRVIARQANRIVRDGRHIHVFTNPHGFTFQIACFDDAPGAASTGEASSEWSWFAGTRWRIALCRGCHGHLGWSFEHDETLFWGFITAKLA